MIIEDYVSLEVAKLLKEKGFDCACTAYYSNNEVEQSSIPADYNKCTPELAISAPTLQMAMKWLREVLNLCIEPYRTACGYLCTVSKVPTGSEVYSQDFDGDDEDSGQFTTYEKACEAAIKYCLESLV